MLASIYPEMFQNELLYEDIYFSGKIDSTILYLLYPEHQVSAWQKSEKHSLSLPYNYYDVFITYINKIAVSICAISLPNSISCTLAS